MAVGERFVLADMPEVSGEVIATGECSVSVKLATMPREVVVHDNTGRERRFTANRGRTETWAPTTLVVPINATHEGEETMSTATKTKAEKKTSKKAAPNAPKSHEAPVAATEAAEPKKAKRPKASPGVASERTPRAKAATPAKPDAGGKMSALDAAAEVLKHANGVAMSAKQLIADMAARGLWTSPGGKTPHATLYSAMLTEINRKGDAARFAKDGGLFSLRG